MTRRDVLSEAIDKCIRELYSLAQPSVDYDDFIKENKEFLEKEKEYYSLPEEEKPPYYEYMGPKPYEFYYLPKEIFKEIADSYVEAYKFDDKQEFLDNIRVLKEYCQEPIVDKWIEGENGDPGHRGYEHPNNIYKEIAKIITKYSIEETTENSDDVIEICNTFFRFLDMAGDFFNWNSYLNTFNTYVYLGGTPNSNKESVIENWKKYRGIDIEIDDSKYNQEEDD